MGLIPNILTLSRIFVIPAIVSCFFICDSFVRYIGASLYLCACFTDFLDGYLARQWEQVSSFGKFCDPVADKILVSIILLMLAGYGVLSGVHLIAAATILAREVMVSGLRSYLGQIQKVLPVTKFSKWKTAIQMAAIAVLMFYFASNNGTLYGCGLTLLWIASFLTVVTGYRYMKRGFKYIEFSAKK